MAGRAHHGGIGEFSSRLDVRRLHPAKLRLSWNIGTLILKLSSGSMTAINGHRNALLLLRARLLGDMSQMEDNALNKDGSRTTSMPTSMAELGSDNSEQELTLGLLGNEKEVLEQIDAALGRIADGRFGRCEECGCDIPRARLHAIPYAALCVNCASRLEIQP